MEPLESLKKIPLKDIAQTPLAFSLYVVVVVLVSVIMGQWVSADDDKDNCRETITQLENQVKAERKEKDEVFKAYLVERGVTQQIQNSVDSAAIKKYKRK